MASIKVKFRPSSLPDREGRIFYQVIHDRRTRHILTEYRLFPHEWNDTSGTLVIKNNTDRTPQLNSLQERIKCDIDRLERIIRQFDSNYKIPQILRLFVGFYRLMLTKELYWHRN